MRPISHLGYHQDSSAVTVAKTSSKKYKRSDHSPARHQHIPPRRVPSSLSRETPLMLSNRIDALLEHAGQKLREKSVEDLNEDMRSPGKGSQPIYDEEFLQLLSTSSNGSTSAGSLEEFANEFLDETNARAWRMATFPSAHPSGRKEVLKLRKWLRNSLSSDALGLDMSQTNGTLADAPLERVLVSRHGRNSSEDMFTRARRVTVLHTLCFHELVRQVKRYGRTESERRPDTIKKRRRGEI